MKISFTLIAAAFLSTTSASFAEDMDKTVNSKIDKNANALKGAINSKMPKKDTTKPAEPSMADKAAAKKEELKTKASAAAADLKAKAEAKKAEQAPKPDNKPSAQDQAKDAAKKAEGKLDGAIKKLGK